MSPARPSLKAWIHQLSPSERSAALAAVLIGGGITLLVLGIKLGEALAAVFG